METYNLQAIVLNRQAFREADLRITIYTKEKGKISLVVRGGKKPSSKLASHIEPFNFSRIMAIHGKQFDYVGSTVCEQSNFNLKADLEKLKYAGQALNIFNKLVKEEGESSTALFNLLRDYLELINNEGLDNNLFYHFFILKLLSELGYRPELKNCVKCAQAINKQPSFFSFSKGGLMCEKCKEISDRPLLFDAINCLMLAINIDFGGLKQVEANRQAKDQIINLINDFYKYQN